MGGIGILGGTFNPIHNGHIRHAIEVGEALGLERVLLTPCASPPHKTSSGLLPFDVRVGLLRAAVREERLLQVNTLEGELEGPSYTWHSLLEWHRRHGGLDASGLPMGERPYFMMGAESFAALDTWHRGLELPKLAHLVMVPRAGGDGDVFCDSIRRFWPGSLPEGYPAPIERQTVRLSSENSGGGLCTFLPVPRLDISSTFIRERWLEGRSLSGLMPEAELAELKAQAASVTECWRSIART